MVSLILINSFEQDYNETNISLTLDRARQYATVFISLQAALQICKTTSSGSTQDWIINKQPQLKFNLTYAAPHLELHHPPVKKVTIDMRLRRIVIGSLSPLSIVETHSFCEFCKECSPTYQVPCSTTLKKHLESEHEQLKSSIKRDISNVSDVAVMTAGLQ